MLYFDKLPKFNIWVQWPGRYLLKGAEWKTIKFNCIYGYGCGKSGQNIYLRLACSQDLALLELKALFLHHITLYLSLKVRLRPTPHIADPDNFNVFTIILAFVRLISFLS